MLVTPDEASARRLLASYDYTRAARDALHFAALFNRLIQNLRLYVGYDDDRRRAEPPPPPRPPDGTAGLQELQRRLPRGSPVGPAGTCTELTTEDALHSADSAWLTAVSAMGSASRRSNPICAAPACRTEGTIPVPNGGNARFVQAEGQSRSVSRGLGGARVACTGARRWRWSGGGRRELRTILGRSSRIWRSRWRWAGNYADRAATAARLSILSLCDTISQPPEPEATRSVLPAVHQWLPRTGRRTSRRVCASSWGSATAGKCPPRSCSCHVVMVK